jgi:hypothetical protein
MLGGAVGFGKGGVLFTNYHDLELQMDSKNRRPTHQWWEEYKQVFEDITHKPEVQTEKKFHM